MGQPNPPQLPSPLQVARVPLSHRLTELAGQAQDAITVATLLYTLAASAALAAVLALSYEGSGSDIFAGHPENKAGWYFLAWLTGTLLAGFGIAAACRGSFRGNFQRALTDLHSTQLALVIADESLRELAYGARENHPVFRWTATTSGQRIETQLQRACDYYESLRAVASGAALKRVVELAPRTGGYTRTTVACLGWGACGCLLMPLGGAGFIVLLLGLIDSMAGHLRRKARLAALCDFYLERESRWMHGWAVRRDDWDTLRGYLLRTLAPQHRRPSPGPFDPGASTCSEEPWEPPPDSPGA